MNKKPVADAIRDRRKQLGMTQEQLGKAAGNRSVNQINGYERGRSRPSPPVLAAIAEALGTTASELLGQEEAPLISRNLVDILDELGDALRGVVGTRAASVQLTIAII